MAIQFLHNVDLNNNELQNAVIEKFTNDTGAGTGVEGQIYYDSTLDVIKVWTGAAWERVGGGDVESVSAGNGITIGGTAVDPTVAVTYSGANSVILDATDGTAITLASTDKFLIVDDSDASDTVKYVNFSQLSTALGSYDWNIQGDSGGAFTIASGDLVDIAGGTKLTTVSSDVTTTTTIQINHDNTTRTDTTSNAGPAHGGTFDVIDSVTSDATGHITAVNVKTVTLPADNNTITNAFTTHTTTDTDSGYSWTSEGSATADSTSDTLTWVQGNAINIDVDATNDAIRISHADTSTITGALGTSGIQSITIDGNGHVTAVTPATYNNYAHPNHTGHVTSTGDGATVLTVAAITGQTELASGLASTDELVLSDGGVIKRMDISVLETYMESNLSDADTTYTLPVAAGGTNTAVINLTAGGSGSGIASSVTFSGTTDEIEITETTGNNGTIQIGLPTNVVIAGDLTVNGSTTTISTNNLLVEDALIGLQSELTGANTNDIGFIFERGSSGANGVFIWDRSAGEFALGTTTATPASTGDLTYTTGSLIADLSGNADTATKWAAPVTVQFATGDVTGSFSIDGSANVSNVALTIAANSVALGTDTTGNYVATVAEASANNLLGIDVAGATGEGQAAVVGLDISGRTALTSAAPDDSLLIYDLDVTTNKRITVANLAAFGQAVIVLNSATTGIESADVGGVRTWTVTLNDFITGADGRNCMVELMDTTSYQTAYAEIGRTSTTITVAIVGTPAQGAYQILVRELV